MHESFVFKLTTRALMNMEGLNEFKPRLSLARLPFAGSGNSPVKNQSSKLIKVLKDATLERLKATTDPT